MGGAEGGIGFDLLPPGFACNRAGDETKPGADSGSRPGKSVATIAPEHAANHRAPQGPAKGLGWKTLGVSGHQRARHH